MVTSYMSEAGPLSFTRIYDTKIAKRAIAKFDELVAAHGLSAALRGEIEKRKGVLTVDFQDQATETVLQERPTIVIATHPNDIEPFAVIAALPPRKEKDDVSILSHAANTATLGPNAKSHLIPVCVEYHPTNRPILKLSRMLFGRNLKREEASRMNARAIVEAVDKVKAGGLLLVLADGLGGESLDWVDGTGFLLRRIVKVRPDAQLVMAHTRGISSVLDELRLFPKIRDVWPVSAHVTFSAPQSIEEIVKPQQESSETAESRGRDISHQITKDLQVHYREWAKSLLSPASSPE